MNVALGTIVILNDSVLRQKTVLSTLYRECLVVLLEEGLRTEMLQKMNVKLGEDW